MGIQIIALETSVLGLWRCFSNGDICSTSILWRFIWGWNGWFLYWGEWKWNALKIIDLLEIVAKMQQHSASENEIKWGTEAFK